MNIIYSVPCLLLITVQLLIADVVKAEPLVIIVNSSNNQSIDFEDIKHIYEDKISNWSSGEKIQVYHLPVETEERERFSKSVLGVSAVKGASEVSNRIITNTAKNVTSTKRERLLVSLITRRPTSIGYARKSAVADKKGVRIVYQID